MNPRKPLCPLVCCSAWILLMPLQVTGRSLSPNITRIAGLVPIQSVEVSASALGVGNHDAESGRPVSSDHAFYAQ